MEITRAEGSELPAPEEAIGLIAPSRRQATGSQRRLQIFEFRLAPPLSRGRSGMGHGPALLSTETKVRSGVACCRNLSADRTAAFRSRRCRVRLHNRQAWVMNGRRKRRPTGYLRGINRGQPAETRFVFVSERGSPMVFPACQRTRPLWQC